MRSHSSRTQLHVGIESHTQALLSQNTVPAGKVYGGGAGVFSTVTEDASDDGLFDEASQRAYAVMGVLLGLLYSQ